ncbi:MAG: hypothetical protein J5776_02640 [Clostridiales bacterium]|nr:hypothetical protein [Clostridiales bacterium]
MRLKNNKAISFLLILALSLQLSGCLGIANDMTSKPSDVITSLESAVHSLNRSNILVLTTIEKGSSRYKEYSDELDISSYTDDAEKCYKAVASAIDIKYDESAVESGNGIIKVRVTFSIPKWKSVFEDSSLSGADAVAEAVAKAEKEKTEITLRLVESKEGLKIKNADDLMEIFDFIGYEIAGLSGSSEPTEATTSSEETVPSKETRPADPTEPEPSESEPEPSASNETTRSPKPGSKDDLAAAYADYKALLQKNKEGIAWFEENVSKDSCGITDLNGDGIPELFFFSKSSSNENFINFDIYSYNPAKKATSNYLSTSLTDATSKVSEFAVIKCPNGDVVTYKGFLDEKSVISYYTIYEYHDRASFLLYSGFMICGVTGGDTNGAVCSVSGFDKYTSSSQIKYEDFLRIEKDLLTKADVLFCAKFISAQKSSASTVLEGRKSNAQSYAALIKQING